MKPWTSSFSSNYTPSLFIPSNPYNSHTFFPIRRRFIISCTSAPDSGGNTNVNDDSNGVTDSVKLPQGVVEVRFKRRSRRQGRQVRDDVAAASSKVKPLEAKKWEDMSLAEKAVDLYMGEKGMLFWLNKFAYASIFIMIGAWILFRFVGPSLNLYQLDTPPLSPSSIFKGSS